MTISEKEVLHLLHKIIDPITQCNIVSLGIVSHILVDENCNVKFSLEVDRKSMPRRGNLASECKLLLESVNGINKVAVTMTNHTDNTYNVARKTILIASGKGGVGKSTIALNIAVGLAGKGYKVAIVDADIYGPSIPHLLGMEGKPDVENGKFIPFDKYGVKSMSIGYFLPSKEEAVVWRGAMITKSLKQMILGTFWNDLDYMIVDTPPGTGDIHISLSKICTISSAIIVSTPQNLAIIDALKAINMFKKLDILVSGVIENMSYFLDSNKKKQFFFGEAGGRLLAEKCSVKFLGEIPINKTICSSSDLGVPAILDEETSVLFSKILQYVI